MADNPYKSPIDDLKGQIKDISNERAWSIGCYVPVINVVICVIASIRMVNSKICSFHIRQGLVIFGLWFLTILLSFVSQALGLMMWGIVLLLYISGLIIAFSGKMTKIPLIGQIAEQIPENFLFETLTGRKADDSKNI